MCHFKGNGVDFHSSFYLESKKVDFLTLLGEKTGHSLIVSKIFSYLSGSDLQNVSKVSKTWQRLCLSDRAAALKMKRFIAKRRTLKENDLGCNSMQLCNESTPQKRKPLACWNENYNFANLKQTPRSPPISPRLKKFNQYLKEGLKLNKKGKLTPCPRCSSPSHVNDEEISARCIQSYCSFYFCLRCQCPYHYGTTCKYFITSSPSSSPSKSTSDFCDVKYSTEIRRHVEATSSFEVGKITDSAIVLYMNAIAVADRQFDLQLCKIGGGHLPKFFSALTGINHAKIMLPKPSPPKG